MALSPEQINQIIADWWNNYQVDPRSVYNDIMSGLRTGPPEYTPASVDDVKSFYEKHHYTLLPCQYWIKGLPGICKNWDGNKCTAQVNPDTGLYPTGYNTDGACDGLGRRYWCDQYTTSGDKLDEYVCVAPCMERCGLGKRIENEEFVSFVPYKKSEIAGYNEDTGDGARGVGRCDGRGLGRGANYYMLSLDEMVKLPPLCRHYRPWTMGFGAIKPRPIRKDARGNIYVPPTLKELHDGTKYDPLQPMEYQLPLAFKIYNLRAKFQTCAHWKPGVGATWILNYQGDRPILDLLDGDPETDCDCPAAMGCGPYKTYTTKWVEGLVEMLQYTWAEAGCVICNGAKPECPCYTGRWNYCIDDKMMDGLRLTAEQILELRFWADSWENQADYEDAFTQKPGPTVDGLYGDPSTADIFTFDKWRKLTPDPNQSIMAGHRSRLLIPANEEGVGRSFDPLTMIERTEVLYPLAEERGTTTVEGQQSYPTLVRDPAGDGFQFPWLPPFIVVYPGSMFGADKSTVVHNVIDMNKAGVSVIGKGVAERNVYAINLSHINFDKGSAYRSAEEGSDLSVELTEIFDTYRSKNRIPQQKWAEFDLSMRNWLRLVSKKSNTFYQTTETNDTGAFAFGPLEVSHNGYNKILVAIDYSGNHNYDYRIRNVYTNFWGTWMVQDYFNSSLPEGNENNVIQPTSPYSFSPPGEVGFSIGQIRGETKPENVFPVQSTMVFGTMGNSAIVSYVLSEFSETIGPNEKWTQLLGSYYIWAEVETVNFNLLHISKIDRVYLKYKEKDGEERPQINECASGMLDEETLELDLEIVLPDAFKPEFQGEGVIKRAYLHPAHVLLRTPLTGIDATTRLTAFLSKDDWDLFFDIRYQKLELVVEEGDEGDEGGEGTGDFDDSAGDLGGGFGGDIGEGFGGDNSGDSEDGSGGTGPQGAQVWPPPNSDFYSIQAPSFAITPVAVGGGSSDVTYKIENWSTGTAAAFSYNTDSDGRKWAASAVKFVGMMNSLECRNVEIFYAYRAAAKGYQLEPSSSFITWIGGPTVTATGGGGEGGSSSGGDTPGTGGSDPGGAGDDIGGTWGDVGGNNSSEINEGIFGGAGGYDSGAKIHYRRALCGDHDCNPGNCIGPMWYPYDNCTNIAFYNVHVGPGACTASLNPEMKEGVREEHRYCVAERFRPYADSGGNWASSCGAEWTLSYSEAEMSGMEFAGYAKIVGKIDRGYYEMQGWAPPPFGYSGREYVERWLTRDWTSHLMLVGGKWLTVFEFMPYVLDKVDLISNLNCFADTDPDNPINEPFLHSSTLSWLSLESQGGEGGENLPQEGDRLRFEEALKVQWHGLCMYPYPLWEYEFGYRTARYIFNQEDISWVWREYWKEIERAQPEEGYNSETARSLTDFPFLSLDRPEYYIDLYKEEHRLITDEGNTVISYTGPIPTAEEKTEAAEKGEAAPDMKYPSISLGTAGFPRFFKILYAPNEYDGSNVEWQDEGTQGAASGSGGDYEEDENTEDLVEDEEPTTPPSSNIYETALDPPGTSIGARKWLNDFNTIFDENASPEPQEDRSAVVGIDIDGEPVFSYYNRGLVAGIAKNKLNFLPMSLKIGKRPNYEREPDLDPLENCEVWSYIYGEHPKFFWAPDDLDQNETNEDEEDQTAPEPTLYKIIIKGKWGFVVNPKDQSLTYYCLPKYTVNESLHGIVTNTGAEIPTEFSEDFELEKIVEGEGGSGRTLREVATEQQRQKGLMIDYEIELIIEPWPYRMLARTKRSELVLEIIPTNYLAISSIEVISVVYEESASERIRIWERKYLPARSSNSNMNPDGPNSNILRSYDRNLRNAGQYYPASTGAPAGSFRDKMTIINSGPYHGTLTHTDIPVSSLSDLKVVEKDEQMNLYKDAYNRDHYDETSYKQIMPYNITQFLDKAGVRITFGPNKIVPINSQKLPWDNHALHDAFRDDLDFWQPAGHYFQWGDVGTSTRCYIFGVIRDVYRANFVHAHSDSKEIAMTPGHAYNGWARKDYYDGKMMQNAALGRTDDPRAWGAADGLTGGKNRLSTVPR